jgi:hypothetical protein
MVVKVYDNAKAYLFQNEAVLLENEAVSQLVLYNAYLGRQNPEYNDILFGVVMDDDQVVLHF